MSAPAESQATFSSLCLTSKHFLPLAREYLYYRPIRIRNAYREPAIALLCTFAAPSSIQAQLVRSLEGLVDYIQQLKLDGFGQLHSVAPYIEGIVSSFVFLIKMIEGTVNLHSVDLTFSTAREFTLIQQALEGCSSTLKVVHFKSVEGYRLSNYFTEVLHSPIFGQIEILEWTGFDLHLRRPSSVSSPSIRLPLKTLRICEDSGLLGNVKQFFLVHSSSLTGFSVQLNHFDDSDIAYILTSLPATLSQLSITCSSNVKDPNFRPSMKKYVRDQILSQTRFSDISRFTSLQYLNLNGFQALFPQILQTLATSSPTLIGFNFSNSYWSRPSNSSRAPKAKSIFPVSDITETLARFESLRFVHFGFLPTRYTGTYDELLIELESRGIEVKWVACRPHVQVCPCGSRH